MKFGRSCGAKARTCRPKSAAQWGDIWTWTAIDADSKLIVVARSAARDAGDGYDFMHDVAGRLTNRVQLTTDNHQVYLNAVDYAFGIDVDYAMLEKNYGRRQQHEPRYSPANIHRHRRPRRSPATRTEAHLDQSYVERQNLTMRMHMRRFARLTNGFSKKIEKHAHSVALHFMYYNFCKIHQTLASLRRWKLASPPVLGSCRIWWRF